METQTQLPTRQFLNLYNAELILYKSWRVLINLKSSKMSCYLFPNHLNTYVMGLRSLEMF